MVLRRRDLAGLSLLSASALFLEVSATRSLSVALWHHFAVMVISCALLGIGVSGALLALRRRLARPEALAAWPALFSASAALAFVLLATSPIDPYALALAHERLWLVPLHYLVLAAPFAFSGLLVGSAYALEAARPHRVYLADAAGAAAGCLAAASWGGPAAPLAAALGGALACPLLARSRGPALAGAGLALALALALAGPTLPELPLSPYKGLSRDLRVEGATLVSTRWGPSSRVDVLEVARPGGGSPLRSAPGLSLSCPWAVPPQPRLYVDGEAAGGFPQGDLAFTACLPQAAALPPSPGRVLVLRPGAGLDVAVALRAGASEVVAAEPDPILLDALSERLPPGPRVKLEGDAPRSALARSRGLYGAVLITQGGSAASSSAGLATLDADELLTVEGLGAALDALAPGGLLVVTRYLQPVPRDEVKLAAAIAEALRARGSAEPARHLAVVATVSTYTAVASPGPLPDGELARLRARSQEMGWTLVLPDPGGLTGVEGRLTEDLRAVTAADPAEAARAVAAHPFDVRPPTDDRPFFRRFFRADRLRDLYRGGGTWEPLLEGGFVVPLALAQAAALAALLVLLPLRAAGAAPTAAQAAYFSLAGLGYMGVEVALMHMLLPLLATPSASMAVTLASVLASSGAGALMSSRLRRPERAVAALGALCLLAPVALGTLVPALLPLGRLGRAAAAAALTAALGLLMGVPFPTGISRLGSGSVPAAWALNGAASVVGSLAALQIGMSWGFGLTLALSGLCYLAAAWLVPGRAGAG